MAYGSITNQTPSIDLSDYATKNDLSNYVTTEQLNSSLADYPSTSDLDKMPTVAYTYHLPRGSYLIGSGSTSVQSTITTGSSSNSWSFQVTRTSTGIPFLLFVVCSMFFNQYSSSGTAGWIKVGNTSIPTIYNKRYNVTTRYGLCWPLTRIEAESSNYEYVYSVLDGSGNLQGETILTSTNYIQVSGSCFNCSGTVSVSFYGWGGIYSSY